MEGSRCSPTQVRSRLPFGGHRSAKTASLISGRSNLFSRQTSVRNLRCLSERAAATDSHRPCQGPPQSDSLQIPSFSLFGHLRNLDREVNSREKWAIQATICRPKWWNSLKISLFAGNTIREEFDADCVHRHKLIGYDESRRPLGYLQGYVSPSVGVLLKTELRDAGVDGHCGSAS